MGAVAVTTIQNWTSAQEPIAKKQFVLALGREVKMTRDMFFDVVSSDKLRETYFDYGDLGNMPEFDGTTQYESWVQNYEQQIVAKLFRKGISIDYKFIRTDQQNVTKDASRMLGLCARRRVGGDAMMPFNSAFDGSYTTRDGLALCHTAHTSNVGGATQGNKGTVAFSPAALEAVRILMRQFRTNRDNEMDIMPDMIVGGVTLDGPFQEVLGSTLVPNSANNNINIHKGKYTAVTSIRIVDQNNWWVIDKTLMKQFLKWNKVDDIDFKQDSDFDARASKMVVDAFYGHGPTGWEFIYGNDVA